MGTQRHHQADHSTQAERFAEALSPELGIGFVPPEAASTPELEASGLALHGRVDVSDTLVVDRALSTLALEETQLDLIRADARAWLETSGT